MSTQPEVWRVSTVEGIFETDLETLKQWIREDCVLPTDKVSKGTLNWIDAGRVPQLKAAFGGEVSSPPPLESFSPPPGIATETTTWVEPAPVSTLPVPVSTPPSTNVCSNHPEANPEYVCRMCGAVFCKACPKFVRDRVPICPLCGDLCRKYQEVREKIARRELQQSGFGVADFIRAFRYPLRHKTALFGGALIYGLLLLAGTNGILSASTLMFGCISLTITHVAWGRLNRSFMPDFSAYSTWDDFLVPGLLGLGIMIVSWGPVIALTVALTFGVVGSGGVDPSSLRSGNQVAESKAPNISVLTDPNADPAKLEAENKKLEELQPAAQIAREAEKSKEEASDPLGLFRGLLPYVGTRTTGGVLLLLCILWGLFYYPMALTVAGYTQSVGSVLNPLVGLDTIRRMRTTYFKAFGMVVVIQAISFVLGVIIFTITAALALPLVGNVLANFIDATFTFYLNLVIACILGLSLFKCADRLDIQVD
jgi:hypothetical protein